MLAKIVNDKKFKTALAIAMAIAVSLNIYETYQTIQLNKAALNKNEVV